MATCLDSWPAWVDWVLPFACEAAAASRPEAAILLWLTREGSSDVGTSAGRLEAAHEAGIRRRLGGVAPASRLAEAVGGTELGGEVRSIAAAPGFCKGAGRRSSPLRWHGERAEPALWVGIHALEITGCIAGVRVW